MLHGGDYSRTLSSRGKMQCMRGSGSREVQWGIWRKNTFGGRLETGPASDWPAGLRPAQAHGCCQIFASLVGSPSRCSGGRGLKQRRAAWQQRGGGRQQRPRGDAGGTMAKWKRWCCCWCWWCSTGRRDGKDEEVQEARCVLQAIADGTMLLGNNKTGAAGRVIRCSMQCLKRQTRAREGRRSGWC